MANSKADGTAAKPAWKPVEHTEEARKAQRASLTWSALTIVAALGEYIPPADDAAARNEHVRLLPFNLHYEQWQIVLMLWVAALVYGLFYARAERVVRLANSEAARTQAQSWEDALNLADSVKALVAGMEARARSIRQTFDRIEPAASNYRLALLERAQALPRAVEDRPSSRPTRLQRFRTEVDSAASHFVRRATDYISMPGYSPATGDVEMVAEELRSGVADAADQYSMALDESLHETHKLLEDEMGKALGLSEEIKPALEHAETKRISLESSVAKLHRDLTRFRRGVDRPERFFYFTLDVGLVVFAFALATILMFAKTYVVALEWLRGLLG